MYIDNETADEKVTPAATSYLTLNRKVKIRNWMCMKLQLFQ